MTPEREIAAKKRWKRIEANITDPFSFGRHFEVNGDRFTLRNEFRGKTADRTDERGGSEDGGVRAGIARALDEFVAEDAAARTKSNGKVHFAQGIGPWRAIPLFIEGGTNERDAPLIFAWSKLLSTARPIALIQEALDFCVREGLLARLAVGLAFSGLLITLDELTLLTHLFEAVLTGFLFFLLEFRGSFLFLFRLWLLRDFFDRVNFWVVLDFRRLGFGFRLGWWWRGLVGRRGLEGRRFIFVAVKILLDDDGEVDWNDGFFRLAGDDREKESEKEEGQVEGEREREATHTQDFGALQFGVCSIE